MARRLVVGLGNPGARYAATRHNVGFAVVDLVARARGAALERRAHGALCAEVEIAGHDVLLVEPQRYMNRSGEAVAAFVRETGVAPTDVLVVHDDLDLPLGRIKLKRGGGTAGHRGLESVVEHLEGRDFDRLRVGIGRPAPGVEVVDHVLEPFSAEEGAVLEGRLEAAAAAVEAWCALPIETAMSRVNVAPPGGPSGPEGPA
ncbi:MAG: aminoacyl-tRNA hydrolase [Thermodesulfobacteriota bacterium]